MYCVAFLFLLSGKTLSYLISWKKFALDRNLNLDLFIIRVGINRFLWLLIELPHFDRFVQFIFYNKVRNFWPLFVTDLVPRIFSCLVLLQITFYKCFFLICIECVIFYHFWKKFCSNFCDNFHAFKSSQNFFKSCVLTEMIYQQEIWVHWTTKSFLDTEETSITLWWQKSLHAFKSQREFFRRNTNARMSYFRPFIVITLSRNYLMIK